MTKEQTVQIAEAKGRPMLHWVGKRPLDHVTAFPAQLVETFNPPAKNSAPLISGEGPGAGVASSSTATTRTCWPGSWPTATGAR